MAREWPYDDFVAFPPCTGCGAPSGVQHGVLCPAWAAVQEKRARIHARDHANSGAGGSPDSCHACAADKMMRCQLYEDFAPGGSIVGEAFAQQRPRRGYGEPSPEMTAAVNVVRSANRDREMMQDALNNAVKHRDLALAERDKARAAVENAHRAHRGQIDMTTEERERADRAEALLARALPILADLVPKFPEAADLCREIKAVADASVPVVRLPAGDYEFGVDLAVKPGMCTPPRVRHADLFYGYRFEHIDAFECRRCKGQWACREDIPEFCDPR